MTIQTTIIPQKVDLSTTTDGKYISYPKISGINKLTFGKEAFNSLGLLDLRATVLENNDSITGATNNFSDIFTTNTGLLNTVNTTDTTSLYDNNNYLYNNKKLVTYEDTTTYLSDSLQDGDIEYLKNFVITGGVVTSIVVSAKSNNGSLRVRIRYNYDDATTSETWSGYITSSYADYSFGTSDINKTVLSVDVGFAAYNIDSGRINDVKLSYYNGVDETKISLNYNKANPKGLYFIPYSSEIGTDEIGDVTISLYTGTTLLGTYNPYQIYEGLTLASTPDKAVINQKDTSLSKISKYVLLIQE